MDFRLILKLFNWLFISSVILGSSVLSPGDSTENVRAFTRNKEFDYVSWTLDALEIKLSETALGLDNYLDEEAADQVLLDYLDLINQIQRTEFNIQQIYADPAITNPEEASKELNFELDVLKRNKRDLAPLAETVLQNQLSAILSNYDMTVGGQPLPPVLFHSTPLPWALIVSPRDEIVQQNNISLKPDLTLEEQIALEEEVAEKLDVSTLVVPIGGVGTYPTMIYQTSNLNWLAEVVAHEWVHNFLTLRPLGANYLSSPELRIINETTAEIAGNELGRALIERYYPDRLPPPPPPPSETTEENQPVSPEPPAFDFNKEMRITRVNTDALLAEGKVDEAEAYMESRRKMFWDNGYLVRKLNQAYFAFHGAYADVPGGAAGDDPVGGAVRTLRVQSSSLAKFLKRISWVTSYEQLTKMVNEP